MPALLHCTTRPISPPDPRHPNTRQRYALPAQPAILAGAAVRAPVSATSTRPLRTVPTEVVGRMVSGALSRQPDKAWEVVVDPGKAPLSVVLIDDNRLLREGLAAMIQTQQGFKVLAASADVEEALQVLRESKPDVVLVDFGLADHDSLRLTATVRAQVPEAKVVVMGLLPIQENVADFVRAGASGFIMKDASFEDFLRTIRSVAAGDEVLPPALTNLLFTQIVKNVPVAARSQLLEGVRLTNRERQVIDLLTEGLCNKEIGTRLHIAIHTVKSHVHNVLEKLELHSRLEVAAFTHAQGWPHSTVTRD